MENTNLIELSLYYKLKEFLSEKIELEEAVSEDQIVYSLQKNLIETNSAIEVFVNQELVETSEYTVNYMQGTITFHSPLVSSDLVTANYQASKVHFYDINKEFITDQFNYPAICIYESKRKYEPIEFGTARKSIIANWFIDVWSDDVKQRNDISDQVITLLLEEDIDIVDYNVSLPIHADGTINPIFNPQNNILGNLLMNSINYEKKGSLDNETTTTYLTQINTEFVVNITN
ncbi:hypothetical protein [Chengkuizengella axinellae]|uniref:DUF2612 domain-containing protein n=1 Tax=Chengkuizengella axinellae TaxID=3064388 RepID=A0ABT9IWA9_9BACL|nr:hypothetical protein [Chengkuizengella sp. 2205SS18-9]MDP5273656.1 hypothetical protein [Chengkuizengella sp. 2205SS18-9]